MLEQNVVPVITQGRLKPHFRRRTSLVNEIMNANSYKVFRLTSYHTGLKPMDFIWADVQHLFDANQ